MGQLMEGSITHQKAELRAQMRSTLSQCDSATRAAASTHIAAGLTQTAPVQAAATIGLFAALSSEVDLTTFHTWAIAHGKQVAYPRIGSAARELQFHLVTDANAELTPGPHGARAPQAQAPSATWTARDCVCVPGLAFDRTGHRLGRGGGHYDAWLANFPGTKIGVAFAAQLMSNIPCDPWDECVDLLVTETDVIMCQKERGFV